MGRLTAAQFNLLRDLIALEDAGYLSSGTEAYVTESYEDLQFVTIPPIVTYEGRRIVSTLATSPDTQEPTP